MLVLDLRNCKEYFLTFSMERELSTSFYFVANGGCMTPFPNKKYYERLKLSELWKEQKKMRTKEKNVVSCDHSNPPHCRFGMKKKSQRKKDEFYFLFGS